MPVSLQIDFDKNKHSELMRKCSLLASEAEINKAISKGAKKRRTKLKRKLLSNSSADTPYLALK
jgi:hypothetical protein